MVPVLIAGLMAMVAAVVIGPKFIEMLRARNLGQQIRAEGPAAHVVKQGTPTMGGLLIVGPAVLPFLALSQYTAEGLTVLFITLGVRGDRASPTTTSRSGSGHSLGLPGRWKMVLLVAITVGAAILLRETSRFDTSIYVPRRRLGPRPRASSTTRSSSSSSPARSTARTSPTGSTGSPRAPRRSCS